MSRQDCRRTANVTVVRQVLAKGVRIFPRLVRSGAYENFDDVHVYEDEYSDVRGESKG
jgi:hypothetical protein